MSVEPGELMSEDWTRWQGHLINGTFPLGRYIGCSDHSGVFVTESAALGPSQVAVKLVPTDRAMAELQLPRWKKAGSLSHPHLLGLLQWGGCQLDGLPYLYAVMEYADQNLAQLLVHRALTEDEAREMLLPTLDALAFLHDRNLVQGRLKPANILVVGDQLKLASDTIRRVDDGTHGSSSTAGDIWALGATLFEALTRRAPGKPTEAVALPADLPEALRDVVSRCLSPSAHDRPGVAELVAWARGESAPSAVAVETVQPAAIAAPEPRTPEPTAPEPALSPTLPLRAAPEATLSALSMARAPKPGALLIVLGALAIVALCWYGVRVLTTHRAPVSPAVQVPGESASQTAGAAAAAVQEPVSAPSTTKPAQSDVTTSPSTLHEVIPDVSRSARESIRGHIKVWVRVIVDQDGSVSAADADRAGPSRYFQGLALEAAKKWKFLPADGTSRRVMQVQFDFSRDGTTGRAVPLR
jgi:TonB family protein